MNSPEDSRALAAAKLELRSAHALLVDHRCDPASAVVHLERAWRAIAWLSRHELPPDVGEEHDDQSRELDAWLAAEHLALVPARTHAELDATLRAILRYPDDAPPWTEAPPAELPSTRALVRHRRALSTLVRGLEAQLLGRPPKRQLALRWTARALAWSMAAAAAIALVIRPWQQREDRWRGAYYSNDEFDGKPDLRRDADVDFAWEDQVTDTILADMFSARWDTCLILDEEVEAAFQIVSSSNTRVYVDGELLIDATHGAWSEVEGERTSLGPGRHHLQVEFHTSRQRSRRHRPKLHLLASFDPAEAPLPIPQQMLEFPGMDIEEAEDPCRP